MADLRKGNYGYYYGTLFSESEGLSLDEMKVNARYIQRALTEEGWTKNAIAGILGNMQAESSMNPGRWQSENVGNTSGGYGLVQWTPASKYLDWVSANNLGDASSMDNNIARIMYELKNNIQWIATSEYSITFEEFSTSTESAEYLASAFLKCYERAGVEVEETRRSNAKYWFDFLGSSGGSGSSSDSTTIKRRKNFKFILFGKRKRFV